MKTLATGLLALLSVLVAQSSLAQQASNALPDAIFFNGKIITVDPGFTIHQAFAVRGEAYVAVGTNAASGPSPARTRAWSIFGAPRSSPASRTTTIISTTAQK